MLPIDSGTGCDEGVSGWVLLAGRSEYDKQVTRKTGLDKEIDSRFRNWFGNGRCSDAEGGDGSDKSCDELHVYLWLLILLICIYSDKGREGKRGSWPHL